MARSFSEHALILRTFKLLHFQKFPKEKRSSPPPFMYISCSDEDPLEKTHDGADRLPLKSTTLNLNAAYSCAGLPSFIHISAFPDVWLTPSPHPSTSTSSPTASFSVDNLLTSLNNRAIQRKSPSTPHLSCSWCQPLHIGPLPIGPLPSMHGPFMPHSKASPSALTLDSVSSHPSAPWSPPLCPLYRQLHQHIRRLLFPPS